MDAQPEPVAAAGPEPDAGPMAAATPEPAVEPVAGGAPAPQDHAAAGVGPGPAVPEPRPEVAAAVEAEPERPAAPAPDPAGTPGPELIEMALTSVELSPEGLQPATGTVRLLDQAGGGHLDIVMARSDAVLVQEAIAGLPPPRPRAHDLLLAAVAALAGAVTGVSLVERRAGGVYAAVVTVLRPDGSVAELDARPSDALNVALRCHGAVLRAARDLVDVPAN